MIKQIPGYPMYFISEDGDVFTTYRKNGKTMLKPHIDKDGYKRVALYTSKDKRVWIGVHKLVALTFLGGEHQGMVVNHINYDRADNRLENLEWVTPEQNVQHSIQNYRGKKKPIYGVNEIGEVVQYDSLQSAAADQNVSVGNICRSAKHDKWKCNGYKWSYITPINCSVEDR